MPQSDDYGRHEVLHMASFLHGAVVSELCEHRQIKANPEWKSLAEVASESLWKLYQAIGAVHLADEDRSDSAQS